MSELQELHFFSTPEHECSYIDDQKAKTLFVDPKAIITTEAYSQLADLGFRRSGKHVYRPHCGKCQACISVRVPVRSFKANKTQRRIINRNKDIEFSPVTPYFNEEIYSLYERYINIRHSDGDMHPPSKDQFISFLVDGDQAFEFLEMRLDNKLVGVAVTDKLTRGLSATYTFFDPAPELQKRSLGTFAILWQIEECKKLDLDYLYLGYWVQACRKMSYKIAYRPLEFLIDGQWIMIR